MEKVAKMGREGKRIEKMEREKKAEKEREKEKGEIRVTKLYLEGYALWLFYDGICMWRSTGAFPDRPTAVKYAKEFINVRHWELKEDY